MFRLLIYLLLLPLAWAETPIMRVDELRPGMQGLTYTVLQGDKIEPLKTEIMGVAKNYLGPGLDLIIAKLIDPKTELIGSVHGMSGSPLYIDGKLVGALSHGLVDFIKDGQCGYTPIEDMLAVRQMSSTDDLSSTETTLPNFTLSTPIPGVGNTFRAQYLGMPLGISGLSKDLTAQLLDKFHLTELGFVAGDGGGTTTKQKLGPENLVPGAAISAVFMRGDLSAAGTGTVTWRDHDQILAFGHPMMGFGHSHWPMGTAEIITILPSFSDPTKMANQGSIVGTIEQDRSTAIYGRIGVLPNLATYHIERRHNDQPQKELNGQMVSDPELTPMLIAGAIFQAVAAQNEISRDFSLELSGEVRFADLPSLKLGGVYSGEDQELLNAVIEQLRSLTMVMQQHWSRPRVTGVDLSIRMTETQEVWKIERIQLDQSSLEPGQTLKVAVILRERYGARMQEEFSVPLPNALKSGSVGVRVASGRDLDQSAFWSEVSAIKDTDQLINRLNQKRIGNALYLQLVTDDPGEVIGQYELPALPSSVETVMEAPQQSERSVSLNEHVWLETNLPLSGVVYGMKSVNLDIK